MSEEVEICLSNYDSYIFQILRLQVAENAKGWATTRELKT